MHRLVALLVVLQATPARHTPRAVLARATAALPDLRVPLVVTMPGRNATDAMWLFSEGRSHVAFRGPLGQPVSIVRADRGVVSMEFVGERELLALDAGGALSAVSGLALSDLGRLVLGYLPRGCESLEWEPQGWGVEHGALRVRLDREGRVTAARVGEVALRHVHGAVLVNTPSGEIRLELGEPEITRLPERAFEMAEGRVPSISLHRAAELWARSSRRE